MPVDSLLERRIYAITTALLLGLGSTANAQNLPSFMGPIEGRTISSPADTATKNVLALNSMMFELYDDAAKVFQANILKNHPVILGLFTGAGGRFILYRPGMAPLEAPSVPIVYQLLKSVGHSTMALTEIVAPYLDNPDNQSWRSAMSAYRARRKAAVDGLDATPMPAEPRHDCLTKGSISSASLQEFAKKQSPLLKRNIAWAAQTQVGHWMKVIGDWKTMLGSDWDKAYAASNTIYVARQNNILFSVLAQYFGPEAINHRLMLIETISFTSTPDDMLTSLTRIIADRSVGALFFGNLRADGGRRARRGHRGGRKAWDEAVPSAGRAVRLETMADADYAGTWPHLIGRCSLRSLNDRLGMGGARRAPVDRGTGNGLLSH
jgi:hypothetical protein